MPQFFILQFEHSFIQNKHICLLHEEQLVKQFLQYFLLHSVHNILHLKQYDLLHFGQLQQFLHNKCLQDMHKTMHCLQT